MTDNSELATLMQSIPQELFDQIYDLIFAGDSIEIGWTNEAGEPLKFDWTSKWPAVLQVDKASQKLCIANTTFHSRSRYLIKQWFHSLALSQIALLQNVRFDFVAKQPASRFVMRDDGTYPDIDEVTEAKEQREEARCWVHLIYDEVFPITRLRPFTSHRYKPRGSASFLTARAWKAENGVWKAGAEYRWGDDAEDWQRLRPV